MTISLRSERLALLPLASRHRDAFVEYRRNPDVARWQSWTVAYDHADADELIAAQSDDVTSGSGLWLQVAVEDAATRTLYGDVAIRALSDQPDSFELGVTLAPAAQGRGLGTEAVSLVLEYLFEARAAHRVFAITDTRNERAGRLFARAGLRLEGTNVDADWFKGEWTSIDTWAVLARDRA